MMAQVRHSGPPMTLGNMREQDRFLLATNASAQVAPTRFSLVRGKSQEVNNAQRRQG